MKPIFQVLSLSGVFLTVFSSQALMAQSSGSEGLMNGIGIVLMILVFFVFIIWPQTRKAKKHQQLLNSLEKGDEVVTQSGLYGKIYGLTDKVVTLELAPNVRVRMDRQSVAGKQSIEKKAS